MNKLTFKEWSILADLETIALLKEDQEFSMARGELKTAQVAITRLMSKLKGEGDLEAWVQSKITKAAEYLDTVADHLSYGEDDTKRKEEEVKEGVLGRYKEDRGGGKTLRSASERVKPKKSEEKSEPEGPKITRLKTRGPRKGEATASQVQGWRGSDRTNTNRRGQSDPQAKIAMKEGFKGHKSIEEIAKKHKVSPLVIQKQLEMGMKVEHEHTTDNDAAMDIALQHLDEIPNYYSKLKKMEKVKEDVEILDANGNIFAHVIDVIDGSNYKFKSFTQPITEDAVSELESQLKKLNNTSYDSIDKLMRNIMKEHDMTAKELHNAFTKKHDKTPDEWIKELKEEKKGLWSNIRSRREKGLPRKKPGQKGYPKTLDIEEGIKQARKNVGANKCWMGKKLGNPATKMKGGKEVPNCVPIKESNEALRYCPKCKKNETMKECRYGEEYWKMFSLPASLALDAYDPNDIHPANEGVSFEIGAGHNAAKRSAKIRNLATGNTNPNEKSAALKKLSGPSLPLADSVIQPGQLTTEDYQRIQSSGNVYTILFSWRGRPMMNLQLFFPSMNRPSREEVKTQIEKLYPGAIIMQWHPSPADPSKPIVVIQK